MDKKLIVSKAEIEKMITKASDESSKKTRAELDTTAIRIAGCALECLIEYEEMLRNEGKKEIALKVWCAVNNFNNMMVFDIIKDYGFVNYRSGEDKKYFLTDLGIIELNGTEPRHTPFITCFEGKIKIDDTDDRYKKFVNLIKAHPLFDEDRKYNARLKERNLSYSRVELKAMSRLGIKIPKEEETTNDTQND